MTGRRKRGAGSLLTVPAAGFLVGFGVVLSFGLIGCGEYDLCADPIYQQYHGSCLAR